MNLSESIDNVLAKSEAISNIKNNKEQIIIASIRTDQETGKFQFKTTLVDKHTHWYTLDQNGNGFTDEITTGDQHRHEVKNWIVLTSFGHIHDFDIRQLKMDLQGERVLIDAVTVDYLNSLTEEEGTTDK